MRRIDYRGVGVVYSDEPQYYREGETPASSPSHLPVAIPDSIRGLRLTDRRYGYGGTAWACGSPVDRADAVSRKSREIGDNTIGRWWDHRAELSWSYRCVLASAIDDAIQQPGLAFREF